MEWSVIFYVKEMERAIKPAGKDQCLMVSRESFIALKRTGWWLSSTWQLVGWRERVYKCCNGFALLRAKHPSPYYFVVLLLLLATFTKMPLQLCVILSR